MDDRTQEPEVIDEVVRRFREHPGLRGKSALRVVTEVLGPTDWITGPGDDAAALAGDGAGFLLAAGEAMFPPFVEADPYGAGLAAVIANVNDVAAMGGWTLGIIDTVVGPESHARTVLEGLREGAELYGVAIVGGHLTVRDGPPAVSAFAIGRARSLLAAANAAPGQVLLHAAVLEGGLREDFPIFTSIQERGERLRGDVAVLPLVAEAELCVAAKDVSMAGLLGSLAMLLEPSGVGATVELDRIPIPPGVSITEWTSVFPNFGFLLCSPPERSEACAEAFRERDVACEPVGVLDASGELRVRMAGREMTIARPAADGVTGLGR